MESSCVDFQLLPSLPVQLPLLHTMFPSSELLFRGLEAAMGRRELGSQLAIVLLLLIEKCKICVFARHDLHD